jgi:membrane-bound lytic murein transglycosylase B
MLMLAIAIIGGLLKAQESNSDDVFQSLKVRLINEGRDSTQVVNLFADSRAVFLKKVISLNLIQREIPDAYRGFLNEDQIDDGLIFLRKNQSALDTLLIGTAISPEIIVAMLKIESDLGRRSGNYPIFAVFATLACLDKPIYWEHLADSTRQNSTAELNQRAARRAKWAYRELTDHLDICQQQGWDPLSVKGSWAGAFGWSQFLPSSFQRCARDGDHNGVIDLNSLADAVASIVCYLEAGGWSEKPSSHLRGLLNYNPSRAYADCILEYAHRLAAKNASASEVNNPDRP